MRSLPNLVTIKSDLNNQTNEESFYHENDTGSNVPTFLQITPTL
jgi:hypothetical protein